MTRLPVTFVIPTRNEERNLRATLSLIADWAGQVVVLDSLSEDRTLQIAREFGVQIVQRKFDNFAAHKNWALDNLTLENQWIFLLDADERVSPALRDEIAEVIATDVCDGYYVARMNHFMGRWVRHCGMYPDFNLRLFKHRLGRYEDRLVHEHVILNGRAGYLKNPLDHNDFKGLERWFDRHNTYSSMEALEVRALLDGPQTSRISGHLFKRGPQRRRFLKEFAYRYLPFRSLFVFCWMYFVQLGFLDGRLGFRYSFLRAFLEYQITLKLEEIRTDATSPMLDVAHRDTRDAAALSGAKSPSPN